MAKEDESAVRPIDRNFAANLRTLRERKQISQEELAARMVADGFPFSQATIWKIEQLQRPVRIAEAEALALAVGEPLTYHLTLFETPAYIEAQLRYLTAYEDLRRRRTELEEATRRYINARTRFKTVLEDTNDDLPEDDPIRLGYDAADLESPEFVALSARYEYKHERERRWEPTDRRKKLTKIWNSVIKDEKVADV